MANAGRILIIPKGDWKPEEKYEMLDLVKHNGVSYIAKKDSAGIEPNEYNSDYWQDMFDVNELLSRISALEAKVNSSIL